MLGQGFIQIGEATAFIDGFSEKCKDGNPCDSSGDTIYEVKGKRIRESYFTNYRKFSPQFRAYLIMQYFKDNNMSVTSMSCSCSKCGTVAMDEAFWL